jgi:hypothetical protein
VFDSIIAKLGEGGASDRAACAILGELTSSQCEMPRLGST